MNEILTKRDLVTRGMDALDPNKVGQVAVTRAAGGVAFASAMEVMEFAKLMAVADKAVPKYLRNNAGACLRIVFQAVEWQMSPWAVADKSYEVNDRVAYESQLIHAVIEARAPLRERLMCEYKGEGAERTCTILGRFLDGTLRDYTTPKFKDIRVKNSPLWKDDPDQQLFYYGTRSWARKWCPDVLMGLYTKDELAADPTIGRDEAIAPGLHARLVNADVNREEGHKDGQAETALVEAAKGAADSPADTGQSEAAGDAGSGKTRRRKKKETPTAEVIAPPAIPLAEEVKTPKQWEVYCGAWLKAATSAVEIGQRWNEERKMRNAVGVTADERGPMEAFMKQRVAELGDES